MFRDGVVIGITRGAEREDHTVGPGQCGIVLAGVLTGFNQSLLGLTS